MQDALLREEAKHLLRVAYEQWAVRGGEGMQVNLAEAMRHRGLTHISPHLDTLVDYMEVTGWVEREDPMHHDAVTGHFIRRITARGLRVLREV
jgi:hypothetical protein